MARWPVRSAIAPDRAGMASSGAVFRWPWIALTLASRLSSLARIAAWSEMADGTGGLSCSRARRAASILCRRKGNISSSLTDQQPHPLLVFFVCALHW